MSLCLMEKEPQGTSSYFVQEAGSHITRDMRKQHQSKTKSLEAPWKFADVSLHRKANEAGV